MRNQALKLVLMVALGMMAAGTAAAGTTCDKFGCSTEGPVTPWAGLPNWGFEHLPPGGCRLLAGSSRGIYPVAVKPAFTFPLPVKWITSYVFHAKLYACWMADSWVQDQYGVVDWNSVSNPHVTKYKVLTWWSDLRNGVTSNEHVVQTKATYQNCAVGTQQSVRHGCLSVTVIAEATVSIPPPLKIGGVTAHPTVTFKNFRGDGSYEEIDHDRSPF